MKKFLQFISAVLFCEFAGIIGSIFTFPAIDNWYAGIQKPAFNPPNWIFGPVWTTIFFLMGISLFLIWQAKKKDKKYYQALNLFFIQLGLNILWSVLFFGWHSPFFAFLEVIVLEVFIILTAIKFYKINRLAGLLFLPYIFWVAFASFLNFTIWIIN